MLTTENRSCVACRKRKTRCNKGLPCSNCSRSRKREECVYENDHSQVGPPLPTRHGIGLSMRTPEEALPSSHEESRPEPSAATSASIIDGWGITPASTALSSATNFPNPVPLEDVVTLKNRIRYLEEQLGKSPPSTVSTIPPFSRKLPTDIETTTSRIGGTFHIHHPSPSSASVAQKISTLGQAQAISRSISHKTRLLGQSHWANTLAPLASCSSHYLYTYITPSTAYS